MFIIFERFNDDIMKIMSLARSITFDADAKLSEFVPEVLIELAEFFGPHEFSDEDKMNLQIELQSFKNVVELPLFQDQVKDIHGLLLYLYSQNAAEDIPMYPQFYKLLALIVILPVTSASAERTFSALKLIKTRLRSKMADPWLVDCISANVEKDILQGLTNEDILAQFKSMGKRRLDSVQ